ncbi:MAG: DUF1640 domain-containing protein [Gammaproteobacteria bacterium]|nr:DUF1640 domain-containing protein [Gammaproteobacteria bacterium]MDE0488997.1 DUF1640 domain-containing protein [Gammaproteobacteria bacterium]
MQEVSFDTHAAIRKLEGAGCPAPQAEAMVAVVSEATAVTSRMARDLERIKLQVDTNMATKSDLADLRTETREGFASLKAEIEVRVENRIESLRTDTREGFASQRTEFKDQMVTKGELYRALWIQGGVLATLILSLGAMTLGIAFYAFSGS